MDQGTHFRPVCQLVQEAVRYQLPLHRHGRAGQVPRSGATRRNHRSMGSRDRILYESPSGTENFPSRQVEGNAVRR